MVDNNEVCPDNRSPESDTHVLMVCRNSSRFDKKVLTADFNAMLGMSSLTCRGFHDCRGVSGGREPIRDAGEPECRKPPHTRSHQYPLMDYDHIGLSNANMERLASNPGAVVNWYQTSSFLAPTSKGHF
jgi:hypothetical protein